MYIDNACDNFNLGNNERRARTDSTKQKIFFGKLYPNPNNGTMQYDYSLPIGSIGTLSILDIFGRELASYILSSGNNSLIIQETTLSSGVYVFKVNINGAIVSQNKLIIVKQ
jgi:hypothetical protein